MYLYGLNWYTSDFERFQVLIRELEQELRQRQATHLLANACG